MAASATEMNLLFSEIKARLSERDRQILVLLEQDLGPKEIAKAFDISYTGCRESHPARKGQDGGNTFRDRH